MSEFSEEYAVGMRIYYIFVNELTGTKELYELTVTKVYPNMLIAWENNFFKLQYGTGFFQADYSICNV